MSKFITAMRITKRLLVLLMPAVVLVLFLWFDVHSTALEKSDTIAPQDGSPIPSALSTQQTDSSSKIENAIRQCNADTRNNFGGHISCILVRNAVLTYNEVRYDRNSNVALSAKFPPGRPTRHHMKQIVLTPSDEIRGPTQRHFEVGYFQSPVKGAHWENAWHTIADFFFMMFHTVEPFSSLNPVWFTRTGKDQLRQGCYDQATCMANSLFDPFVKYFSGNVVFVTPSMDPVHVEYLVVGLNTRCSPIATEDVGSTVCQEALQGVRHKLLKAYNIPVPVVHSKHDCPTIHLMSRQGEKYRHITPFSELNDSLEKELESRLGCGKTNIHTIRIGRSMSFADQIRSIVNNSVLIAGRGGGTALSIFLPEGGLYISLSSFDRWSPYRDLIPSWIQLRHVEVGLVHHEDHRRPAQIFGSGKNKYVDPNRAAYLVNPKEVATKVVDTIVEWRSS